MAATGLAKANKCMWCNQPLYDPSTYKWCVRMNVNYQESSWEFDTEDEAVNEGHRIVALVDAVGEGNNTLMLSGEISVDVDMAPSAPELCSDVAPENLLAQFLDEWCGVALHVHIKDEAPGQTFVHETVRDRMPTYVYESWPQAVAARTELEAICEDMGFPLERVELKFVSGRDAEGDWEEAKDFLSRRVTEPWVWNVSYCDMVHAKFTYNQNAAGQAEFDAAKQKHPLATAYSRKMWVAERFFEDCCDTTPLKWVNGFTKPQTLATWLKKVKSDSKVNAYAAESMVTIDRQGLTVRTGWSRWMGADRNVQSHTIPLPKTLKPMSMLAYQSAFQEWFFSMDVSIEVSTFCWRLTTKHQTMGEVTNSEFLVRSFPVTQKKKRKRRLATGQHTIDSFFRPAKKTKRERRQTARF